MYIDYSYYLIADAEVCAPLAIEDAVEQVIDHGISCVQLRMKNQSGQKILVTAKNLLRLLRPRNIPLIINDHIEMAKTLDVHGVHIGQSDTPYLFARKQLGYEKVIGLSLENIQQAKQSRHLDCDYFGVGPIFATPSKKDAAIPLGISQLHLISRLLTTPIVAIGGINQYNLDSVLSTPVAGIAFISAIFSAENPRQMTQQLAQLILKNKSLC
jgi:thiamine-phosphate pyrophosphorylase